MEAEIGRDEACGFLRQRRPRNRGAAAAACSRLRRGELAEPERTSRPEILQRCALAQSVARRAGGDESAARSPRRTGRPRPPSGRATRHRARRKRVQRREEAATAGIDVARRGRRPLPPRSRSAAAHSRVAVGGDDAGHIVECRALASAQGAVTPPSAGRADRPAAGVLLQRERRAAGSTR